ncbi:diguanylate cyclase [Psychrobacillus sp.]|uniref:sensor domain-containing diguanylate cyclase n=1 Tax=Psychrobacillus sp. TaxID=1871623 RepID=UPI0028BE9CB5|nr:diguanylate cyclase [Psychrobacillus sp.]
MKIKYLFVLIPLLFLLTSCEEASKQPPKIAKAGELILTQQDFMNEKSIELSGEWQFFWEELLSEKDIQSRLNKNPHLNLTLPTPSRWESSLGTPFGYGTYYLKVTIPEEKVGNTLAIATTNQNTSYTLSVNGVRVASNGYVGSSIETSEPQYSNRLVYFTPRNKELNIVLHVSNFLQPSGGVINPIYIGTAEQVSIDYQKHLAYTMFIIGSILVMGIYEIFIFFFRRENKEFLFFGLISIAITMYSVLRPPFYITKIAPILPWLWQDRLYLISIFVLFILFLCLVRIMYPKELKLLPVLIGVIATLGITMFTLFTQPVVYREIFTYFFVLVALFMVYVLYVLILAYKRKRPTALVNLVANTLFFASVINDVLLYAHWIDSVPLTSIGFFLYVVIQAINLGKDYARKFDETERLSGDLQKLNVSLEEKVRDRTEELKMKNTELKRQTQLDGLTGIYNRRYFDEYLGIHFQESEPLTLLMMDLDNFKAYNDQYGHVAGDELLITFSQLVKGLCEEDAFVARYGGEEFSVVLPNTSIQEAGQFAENIRILMEEQKFPTGQEGKYVTASIGVSSTEQHAFTEKEQLLERADKALYESKANGKNRVSVL